jgi:hypothetical protein
VGIKVVPLVVLDLIGVLKKIVIIFFESEIL